jgi:hypothetical protein
MDRCFVFETSDNILNDTHSKSSARLIILILLLDCINNGLLTNGKNIFGDAKYLILIHRVDGSVQNQEHCLSQWVFLTKHLDKIKNFLLQLLIEMRLF